MKIPMITNTLLPLKAIKDSKKTTPGEKTNNMIQIATDSTNTCLIFWIFRCLIFIKSGYFGVLELDLVGPHDQL